ncbi:MAG: tRNA-splicing endonuclease [Candidatus Heimdallarchaeota archaeon AB_125]|nr:MAG: tRNA-splicing endonuclease [Candidatus Heimdallarchaeota archaeon AB_125]
MAPKYQAQLMGRRIIVWDIDQGTELYSNGFYGKPMGVRKPNLGDEFRDPCELSAFEALYLLEKKKLSIISEEGEKILKADFSKKCQDFYMNFDSKMNVFRYLRNFGYVVRPGLKFGVDFAVYTKGPGLEHSPYMIQIIEKDGKIDPIELVRAGRLATTVRKNFVIASTIKKKLHFFVFNRYKP